MAYLGEEELYTAYSEASDEADQWRIDYPQYERLADNGLLEDLDENLPEVNDGSLAASLFKLAKRVIKKKMSGRAFALDRDDQWITELANIYWEKKILPNAKSKASPRRKWKDAVRKAAIFGGQPIITLFVQRGDYRGSDFIVPYAQDVKLEAGKDSDEDSDVIFWDVYYSKLQVQNMFEAALEEAGMKLGTDKDGKEKIVKDPEAKENPEPYNKWNLEALQEVIKTNEQSERPGNQQPNTEQGQGKVKRTGIHFCIAFQRGVKAPFVMYHPSTKKSIRTWENPDPTGDIPVHYLYCYQDFINPYGIGIVKLAGGTQNVLDYMRQADILATQLGLRPPKQIKGDEDQVDEDSLVYAQDANWYVGTASVERMEMANDVYRELPGRISMYQTSLQKMIPMGDTTISGTDSGDPQTSKTPAGVKLAAANLSIDDEDFAENVDETYAAVAKSMINTQFANMQGTDLLKLNGEERDMLQKAGIPFDQDEQGQLTGDLNVIWDNARATFDYEVDAEADKTTDEEKQLDGLVKVAEFIKDPTTQALVMSGQPIILGSKRLDPGELIGEIIHLTTDNEKILTDVTPEEQSQAMAAKQAETEAAAMAAAGGQPGQPGALPAGSTPPMQPQAPQGPVVALPAQAAPEMPVTPDEGMAEQPEVPAPPVPGTDFASGTLTPEEEEAGEHIEMVKQAFQVDDHTAAAMLEAERQGFEPEDILQYMQQGQEVPEEELVNV